MSVRTREGRSGELFTVTGNRAARLDLRLLAQRRTWLLRMLAEIDGIVPIDDPHLGHHLGVWRLIQARFEAQVDRTDAAAGRPTVVVKAPGSHVAPLLAELFPASKLIFLLRDGRGVVDSWLDAYREGSWAIPGGAFPVSAEGRIPLIRYERLRSATAKTMEQVCETLELQPGGLQAAIERHSFDRLPDRDRGRGARSTWPGPAPGRSASPPPSRRPCTRCWARRCENRLPNSRAGAGRVGGDARFAATRRGELDSHAQRWGEGRCLDTQLGTDLRAGRGTSVHSDGTS
jgi:hypothetical protein